MLFFRSISLALVLFTTYLYSLSFATPVQQDKAYQLFMGGVAFDQPPSSQQVHTLDGKVRPFQFQAVKSDAVKNLQGVSTLESVWAAGAAPSPLGLRMYFYPTMEMYNNRNPMIDGPFYDGDLNVNPYVGYVELQEIFGLKGISVEHTADKFDVEVKTSTRDFRQEFPGVIEKAFQFYNSDWGITTDWDFFYSGDTQRRLKISFSIKNKSGRLTVKDCIVFDGVVPDNNEKAEINFSHMFGAEKMVVH